MPFAESGEEERFRRKLTQLRNLGMWLFHCMFQPIISYVSCAKNNHVWLNGYGNA